MPYNTVYVQTPSRRVSGHVSRDCGTYKLDGHRGVSTMSPMARPSLLLADPQSGRIRLPELEDVDYVREVLGLSDGVTEADIEQELVSKAAALRIERPPSACPGAQEQRAATVRSFDAPDVHQRRAASMGSDGIADLTTVTMQTPEPAAARRPVTATETAIKRRSRSLSFSQYERYISQVDPALEQSKFQKSELAGGVAAKPSAKKGVRGITRSIAARLKRRRPSPGHPMPCICCREDFPIDNTCLHTLPCGHCYCRDCLAIMVEQPIIDESRMPPRCCTQPIPSTIIRMVLPKEKQQLFLKAVVQYSTPWEARIFCPNTSCGEFIPPTGKPDSKHPFEALCKTCQTRVCTMCKRNAHQLGHDCPEDKESDAVLRMGEKSGWRRCYKCRSLVELAQGCTHITCRCKAQFCYICGAVWDPAVGCPNFCNGEEEMERRRVEEEARLAELEAEKLAQEKAAEAEEREREDAEKRTRESPEFQALRKEQEAEMARFGAYEQRVKQALQARQQRRRLALAEKFSDLMERMRERHAKTEQHLEDRQVMAEIELQASFEEKQKKVRIKLRYMEDYCAGKIAGVAAAEDASQDQQAQTTLTSSSTITGASGEEDHPQMTMPQRQVTERDLEQLRQQYCVRDGMERRHQSQINGLRERQAKSMEELMERHEREREVLASRHAEEVEDLAVEFANEEDTLLRTLAARRARLSTRWRLAADVLRAELEARSGGEKKFAAMPVPQWPPDDDEHATAADDCVNLNYDLADELVELEIGDGKGQATAIEKSHGVMVGVGGP